MSSGTAALHVALRLAGVQPGDEVFCSSATFVATANPILYEKAIPVFVDSEPGTWNICPASLEKAIDTKKRAGKIPKFLVCVDLFGMGARYREILELCRRHGIRVIEDAAEALGSKVDGKSCGGFGDFGVLSFNGNKIISTSGGGMLLVHERALKDKAIFLITQARDRAPFYLHSEAGYNYRLSNICAGIGLGQMEVLPARVEQRRAHYETYRRLLAPVGFEFAAEPSGFYSNRWLTTCLLPANAKLDPHALMTALDSYNIEARRIWKPLHTQPLFKGLEFFSTNPVPVAEMIFDRGLCLPSGTAMNEATVEKVASIIRSLV
jgi:pyridoxal phosphate-dependent aminotransferase EpsN